MGYVFPYYRYCRVKRRLWGEYLHVKDHAARNGKEKFDHFNCNNQLGPIKPALVTTGLEYCTLSKPLK